MLGLPTTGRSPGILSAGARVKTRKPSAARTTHLPQSVTAGRRCRTLLKTTAKQAEERAGAHAAEHLAGAGDQRLLHLGRLGVTHAHQGAVLLREQEECEQRYRSESPRPNGTRIDAAVRTTIVTVSVCMNLVDHAGAGLPASGSRPTPGIPIAPGLHTNQVLRLALQQAGPSGVDTVLGKGSLRVHRVAPTRPHFKMQVRAGDVARAPHRSDRLAALNLLTGTHVDT